MQGGYEDDLVVTLQDVIAFSFQLPICIVDQDKDTRSPGVCIESALRAHDTREKMMQDAHSVIFDEKLISLFEQIAFQPTYQVIHVGWLIIGRLRDFDPVGLLIREEKLEASPELDADRLGGGHEARPGEIRHMLVQTDSERTQQSVEK